MLDLDIQVIEHLVGLSVDQVGLVQASCPLEVADQAATATGSKSQAVVIEVVQGSQSVVQSALAALELESGLAELSYEASDTLRSPLCSLSSYLRRRFLAHRENAVGPSRAAGTGHRTVGTGRVEWLLVGSKRRALGCRKVAADVKASTFSSQWLLAADTSHHWS